MGFSFEYGPDGSSLGLSVIGENGAYLASSNGATAVGTDVGSPGVVAVPEPTSLGLLAVGGLVALRRRRA